MSIQESFQLDALQTEKELRRRLVEIAESRSFLRDQHLMAVCRKLWSGPETEGGLVGQLWIEGIFPSKSAGKSLKDLASSGVISEALVAQLESSGAFSTDRPLYAHQAESIIAAGSGATAHRPGIVVTAGTGAGKTEAFLLPLLNDLFTNVGSKKHSTKAIILYPMNALVNDQVERLYRWLKGQKKITLFHLTSETPEDPRRADDIGYPKFEPCRLRTRQQARENPPDILITNYSMLEYMLCRPQDAPFFSPELRTFVLDEAHLYSGTLAAEISLLLKRVFLRCGKESREILMLATSATLGEGVNNFAAKIFSKDAETIIHIDGAVDRRSFPDASPPGTQSVVMPEQLTTIAGTSFTTAEELVKAPEIVRELAEILSGLVSVDVIRKFTFIPEPAVFLSQVLAYIHFHRDTGGMHPTCRQISRIALPFRLIVGEKGLISSLIPRPGVVRMKGMRLLSGTLQNVFPVLNRSAASSPWGFRMLWACRFPLRLFSGRCRYILKTSVIGYQVVDGVSSFSVTAERKRHDWVRY